MLWSVHSSRLSLQVGPQDPQEAQWLVQDEQELRLGTPDGLHTGIGGGEQEDDQEDADDHERVGGNECHVPQRGRPAAPA